MRAFLRRLPPALVVILFVGIGAGWFALSTRASHGGLGSQASSALPYPPARWRLAPFDALDRTYLWISHIAIYHEHSKPAAFLRPPPWRPDVFPVDRTEQVALQRALDVARDAQRNAAAFEDLARRYSDDAVTRSQGGSFGGVRAAQIPPEFLDAIATLKPGEVSRVIRTPMGFHILKRRPVPREAKVAGKRIVVRYRESWDGRARVKSDRTHEEAFQIAERIIKDAKAGTKSFDQLVKDESENVDWIRGGDLGLLSTIEPGDFPRETERLAALHPGEISEPIDTPDGFEILMRTSSEERPRYVMAYIALKFDPSQPADHAYSEASVSQLAARLSEELRSNPAAFDALRARHCCQRIQRFGQGQGPLGLDEVLARLDIDQIAPAPTKSGFFFYIPKRLDPAKQSEPPPNYELPNPAGPDFARIVQFSQGPELARYARELAAETAKQQLGGSAAHELGQRLERLAVSLEKTTDAAARVRDFKATLEDLESLLGPNEFSAFQSFMNDWGSRIVLGPKNL